MTVDAALPEWGQLASMADSELPLLETALLIARDEYPELETAAYLSMVDEYGQRLNSTLIEFHTE